MSIIPWTFVYPLHFISLWRVQWLALWCILLKASSEREEERRVFSHLVLLQASRVVQNTTCTCRVSQQKGYTEGCTAIWPTLTVLAIIQRRL